MEFLSHHFVKSDSGETARITCGRFQVHLLEDGLCTVYMDRVLDLYQVQLAPEKLYTPQLQKEVMSMVYALCFIQEMNALAEPSEFTLDEAERAFFVEAISLLDLNSADELAPYK